MICTSLSYEFHHPCLPDLGVCLSDLRARRLRENEFLSVAVLL